MEILAPVGNTQSLTAALRSGADAVYLGLSDFNARRNANNFDDGSLKTAVAYCHARNVKVYLTLNTLVYTCELQSALNTAESGAKAGIDGIICADLGLSQLLKNMLPETPLHASTQMTVHTPDALPLLKELGFKRVVPSREMSKTELKKFIEKAKELSIETEVFVHGALCMCMSGQCLMSAHLGGRSGNRGLCAGTCRLPFGLQNENEYALSLKDLSLIDRIGELGALGVDSLKIEGRMKPPEYVATAVSSVREMLKEGSLSNEKRALLEGIFSRNGFTDGYFEGNISRELYGKRTDENVNLSLDSKNKTHELYRNEMQNVGITARFRAKSGENISLILSDGKNSAKAVGNKPEKAINIPASREYILSRLDKFGGTPFKLNSAEIEIGENLSVRSGDINALRHQAAEELLSLRSKVIPKTVTPTVVEKYPKRSHRNPKLIAQFRTLSLFKKCGKLEGISALILPAEELSEPISTDIPIIADIPAGMSRKEVIEKCITNAEKFGYTLLCRNLAGIELAKEKRLPFIAGSEINILNSCSLKTVCDMGAVGAVLSFESRLGEIRNMPDKIPLGLYVYGRTRLMLTRSCPINRGNCKECRHKITDRKHEEFPVFCRAGYSEIFNSRPLYLADRMKEFSSLDFAVLSFCDESEGEISEIIAEYSDISSAVPPEKYTRGLYEKGVL